MNDSRTVIAAFERADSQDLEMVVSDYVRNLEDGEDLLYGMDGLPLLKITWMTVGDSIVAFVEGRVKS